MIDLKDASRDECVRDIVQQHERIAALERMVAQTQQANVTLSAQVSALTTRVTALLAALEAATGGDDRGASGGGNGTPKGMPGHKVGTPAPRPATPRTRRSQAFVRARMTPTAVEVHAVVACPQSGRALTGGSVKRTREVIEVPHVPAVVTQHVSVERCCPCCHTRHTPAVALGGQVVGKQRFGVGLLSLIATLREQGRWPVATIQCGCPLGSMATMHGLSVSVGAIVAAGQQVARAGAGSVAAIREAVRASPVVHLDETGWQEGGVNGYVWTASTPTVRYFTQGRRTGAMVDAILGEAFAGVLVSDFYAAYAHYPGVKQKCWAHLLRDVHDLKEAHAKDGGVQTWAAGVHDVYLRAVAWREEHPQAQGDAREAARQEFARQLQAVYAPWLEANAPQRVLSGRMAKHLHELFVFVVDPQVPPDNNAAERSLRHVVTSRKISGGTRSAAGSATKLALATLFGTWQLRGENPLAACRALLLSPLP